MAHVNIALLTHAYKASKKRYHEAGEDLRKASSGKRAGKKKKYLAAKRHYHAAGKALARARSK